MTDEELIARLRGGGIISNSARIAADRVEALVRERDEATNQLDSARHSVDVLEKRVEALVERLTAAGRDAHEAEALANEALARAERLEEALKVMRDRAMSTRGEQAYRELPVFITRAASAALKGEDHA